MAELIDMDNLSKFKSSYVYDIESEPSDVVESENLSALEKFRDSRMSEIDMELRNGDMDIVDVAPIKSISPDPNAYNPSIYNEPLGKNLTQEVLSPKEIDTSKYGYLGPAMSKLPIPGVQSVNEMSGGSPEISAVAGDLAKNMMGYIGAVPGAISSIATMAPAAGIGMLSAISATAEVVLGGGRSLDDAYDIASQKMEEAMSTIPMYHPQNEYEEDLLNVVFSPMNAIIAAGHKYADMIPSDDLKGAAKFAVDIAAMTVQGALTGGVLRGKKPTSFESSEAVGMKSAARNILAEANKIIDVVEGGKPLGIKEASKIDRLYNSARILKEMAKEEGYGNEVITDAIKSVEGIKGSKNVKKGLAQLYKRASDTIKKQNELQDKNTFTDLEYAKRVRSNNELIEKAKSGDVGKLEPIETPEGIKNHFELVKRLEDIIADESKQPFVLEQTKKVKEFGEEMKRRKERASKRERIKIAKKEKAERIEAEKAEMRKRSYERVSGIEKVDDKTIVKTPEKVVEDVKVKTEIVEKDIETETKPPNIVGDRPSKKEIFLRTTDSEFYKTPAKARKDSLRYKDERVKKAVREDPYLYLDMLVTEANQWIHGDRENISLIYEQIRDLRTNPGIKSFMTDNQMSVFYNRIDNFTTWLDGAERYKHSISEKKLPKVELTESETSLKELWSGESSVNRIQMILKSLGDKGVSEIGESGLRRLINTEWDNLSKSIKDKVYNFAFGDSGSKLSSDPFGVGAGIDVIRGLVRTLYKNKGKSEKVYSGDPASMGAQILWNMVEDVDKYFKDSKKLKEESMKRPISEWKERLMKGAVMQDFTTYQSMYREHLFGKEGLNAFMKHRIEGGTHAKALIMIREASRDIYKGLNKKEIEFLDEFLFARNQLEAIIRTENTKNPYKPDARLNKLNLWTFTEYFPEIKNLNKDRFDAILVAADKYKRYTDKTVNMMFESGLIDKDTYTKLSDVQYYQRMMGVGEEFVKSLNRINKKEGLPKGKANLKDPDPKLSRLPRGKKIDPLRFDSLQLLGTRYVDVIKAVDQNNTYKELAELATKFKENPFARIVGEGDKKSKVVPHKEWKNIKYFEDGVSKDLYISKMIEKEWGRRSDIFDSKTALLVQLASGSSLLKPLAVPLNWDFYLKNIIRDIAHGWYTLESIRSDGKIKSAYSPHLPIGMTQLTGDLISVFPDVIKNKGLIKEYINSGGGMELLARQAFSGLELFKKQDPVPTFRKGKFEKTMDFLSWASNKSEMWTRTAYMLRGLKEIAKREGIDVKEVMKNKEFMLEAAFQSRSVIDYSVSGLYGKAADSGIPFLNAQIQATHGVFKAFKRNKVEGLYKMAQIGGLAAGVYFALRNLFPEASKDIPEEAYARSIPVPLPFPFEDTEGNIRYPYIEIPLDSSQGFASMLTISMAKMFAGEDINVPLVLESLAGTIPATSPGSVLPPVLGSLFTYSLNKDTWSGQDIWRRTDPLSWPKSRSESDMATDQFWKDFGDVTKLSPARSEAAFGKVVPKNIYGDIFNELYNAAFNDIPRNMRSGGMWLSMYKNLPMFRGILKVTHPFVSESKNIKGLNEERIEYELIAGNAADELIVGVLDFDLPIEDFFEFLSDVGEKDPYMAKTLEERFTMEKAFRDANVKNRSIFRSLQRLRPESRAKWFADKLENAPVDEEIELWETITSVEGIVSDRFLEELSKISADESD